MGSVHCYMPDDLKEAAEELVPPISFSELLRLAVLEELRRERDGSRGGE